MMQSVMMKTALIIESVHAAAVRFNGDIFTDSTHWGAYTQAAEKYAEGGNTDDWLDQHIHLVQDGYILSDGSFVSREEALKHARKSGQVGEKRKIGMSGEDWLDSSEVEDSYAPLSTVKQFTDMM